MKSILTFPALSDAGLVFLTDHDGDAALLLAEAGGQHCGTAVLSLLPTQASRHLPLGK